jgi:hypothetical protein
MPWHKVRVYYNREAERQQQLNYRFNVSVLLAATLLFLSLAVGLYPFFEFWFEKPGASAAVNAYHPQSLPDWPTPTQELCAFIAILCFIYIAVYVNFRPK